MNNGNLLMVSALFAATALTGCGGGSGSAAPTPGTTPVATIVQAPAPAPSVPVVTSVPDATYAASSEERAAYEHLNSEKSRCGFGLFAQKKPLDVSSQGHSDWLIVNGTHSHYQSSGTKAFTGITPQDRMVAAGYSVADGAGFTESVNSGNNRKIGFGLFATRNLLNAPYHLLNMLRGYRDVGISVRDDLDVATSLWVGHAALTIDFGYKHADGMQAPVKGSIRTYPCAGSTGVDRMLMGESPNPFPGRNLLNNPVGRSIAVVIDVGSVLVITNATIVNTTTGASVPVLPALTSANDPNTVGGTSYLNPNEATITTDAPLDAMTSYQATIHGTDNGVAFSRTFSFSMGN
jgi:uncharacterized protein YkwD